MLADEFQLYFPQRCSKQVTKVACLPCLSFWHWPTHGPFPNRRFACPARHTTRSFALPGAAPGVAHPAA